MRRTPALTAAAAALGLLAGLGLDPAAPSTGGGEVRPHTLAVEWRAADAAQPVALDAEHLAALGAAMREGAAAEDPDGAAAVKRFARGCDRPAGQVRLEHRRL